MQSMQGMHLGPRLDHAEGDGLIDARHEPLRGPRH